MDDYDFYQVNLYVFNKLHIYFINYSGFCNDNIKGVGNLSSPGCSEINVMSIFNTIPRTKRSHGHKRIQHPNVKKSSKPRTLQGTFNDLLSNIQKPLGIHHIRTILCSLPQRS
jgi:hypothetical protein